MAKRTTQAAQQQAAVLAQAKLLYSPKEAIAVIACSMTTLYELMLRGEIASIKQGRCRRIPRQALEEYVQRQLEEQGVRIGDGGGAAA